MKNKLNILIIFILVTGLLAGCSNSQETQIITPVPSPSIETTPVPSPSIETTPSATAITESGYGAVGSFNNSDFTLEQMLVYAIQDEYLARSEYEYLINELDAGSPFTNIIRAEESHIALLIPLFTAYEFDLPEDTSAEHLIPVESITAALETGVQAEIDNIAMYEQFLETELPDDIRETFISLRDASLKHLDAFQRKLSR